jgi:hypothetical protein
VEGETEKDGCAPNLNLVLSQETKSEEDLKIWTLTVAMMVLVSGAYSFGTQRTAHL